MKITKILFMMITLSSQLHGAFTPFTIYEISNFGSSCKEKPVFTMSNFKSFDEKQFAEKLKLLAESKQLNAKNVSSILKIATR